MNPRFAILLDGGFVTKALQTRLKVFPSVQDIVEETIRIQKLPQFVGHDLLRIYYYDAPPATEILINPIDGIKLNLGTSKIYKRSISLIDQLELEPNFSIRRGETVVRGWKLGTASLNSMLKMPRVPTAQDLVPNVQQKGVDLRIGLDISLLSLRQLVQTIVVLTADSDLIPAFKFARREGMRIALDHLGSPVRRELKAHADWVI